MARRKDDPLIKQLFEGPARDAGSARRDTDDNQEILRQEVLGIIDATGAGAAAGPLDDGLITSYLDGALPDGERVALEARLANSHALREQVSAAASARDTALNSGLSMPPAAIAAYNDVPAPRPARMQSDLQVARAGFLERLFGAAMPSRRWLAATVPVLAVIVVVAVVAPGLMRDEQQPAPGVSADARQGERAREAEARRKPAKEKKSLKAQAPKPKKVERRIAGRTDRKPADKAASGQAVLSTAIVPLNAELRNAVVALGRSQAKAGFRSGKGDLRGGSGVAKAKPKSPETGAKRESRKRRAAPPPGVGDGSQNVAGLTPRHMAVIGRAISPGCPNDPNVCCSGHKVDRHLLDRLLAGQPPLQSFKVLHLSSRACYLTLP